MGHCPEVKYLVVMITSPIHSVLLTVKRVDVSYSIILTSLNFMLVHPCPSLFYFCATFSQFSLFSYPEDGGGRLLSDVGVFVCTRVLGVVFQKAVFIDTPNLKSHIVCLLPGVTSQDTVLKKSDLWKYISSDLQLKKTATVEGWHTRKEQGRINCSCVGTWKIILNDKQY